MCDAALKPSQHMLQKWFYSFISGLNPSLHARVSQEHTERVFTVSPLYPARKGYPSWLRVTSVDDELTDFLKRQLPSLCQDGLHLEDGQTMSIQEVHLPDGPPTFLEPSIQEDRFDPFAWLGAVTPTHLISLIMQRHVHARMTLHFHTPTSLRHRSSASDYIKTHLLPLPSEVFESYARRWEVLTASSSLEIFPEFVRSYTRLSRYQLRTQSNGGWSWGSVTGFTGSVDYTFAGGHSLPDNLRRDREFLVRSCLLLAAMGFFTGTGQLTSFGLGQTFPVFN